MKKQTKAKKSHKLGTSGGYIVSVKVLGKTYTAKGATVSEAISNLKPTGVAKGASILSVSGNGLQKDRILTATQTYRLFNGGRIMREVAIKNTSILFGI